MTTQPEQMEWLGESGESYTYDIHKFEGTWNDVPGNYIFARLNDNRRWTAIYIGETESFKDRLTESHKKLPCARENGFTHVHAHINRDGEQARLDEETDLRANRDTPCNDQ